MGKLRNLVAAVVLLGTAFASPVLAANGAYSTSGNEPTIYQTNWWYSAPVITALSGTPASGTITNVSFAWNYGPLTFNPGNPAFTLNIRGCVNSLCGQTTSKSVTNDTFWAGQPANASWNFSFAAISGTTKVFQPSALSPNRQIGLTVNYQY